MGVIGFVAAYGHLSLAYYDANRAEVDADAAAEAQLYDRLAREHEQPPVNVRGNSQGGAWA